MNEFIFLNTEKILYAGSTFFIIITISIIVVTIFLYIEKKNNKNVEDYLFTMIYDYITNKSKLRRVKNDTKSKINMLLNKEGLYKREQKKMTKMYMKILEEMTNEIINVYNPQDKKEAEKIINNLKNIIEKELLKIESNKKHPD